MNLIITIYQFFAWIASTITGLFNSIVSLITWIWNIFVFLQSLYTLIPGWLLPIAVAFLTASLLLFVIHLGGGKSHD